ncbi:MAG: hypothetical protein DMG22_10705 [Acidobacteria bacterium]|nr:MAG: hypothetical protein DMG22_10705 [Acidobacteriota bacterium]
MGRGVDETISRRAGRHRTRIPGGGHGSGGHNPSPIDGELCDQSARLRAKYQWLRTPHAIQVACAIRYKANLIITNDDRWKRLTEVPVIVLQDYAGAKP